MVAVLAGLASVDLAGLAQDYFVENLDALEADSNLVWDLLAARLAALGTIITYKNHHQYTNHL